MISIRKAADKLREVEKRLRQSGKDKPSLLNQALLSQAASTSHPLQHLEKGAQQYRDALLMLDSYEYLFDPPAPVVHTIRWSSMF